MVLESPRAGALFKICDPKIATALAMLATPRRLKELRGQDRFLGLELLALLLDCQILFKIDRVHDSGLRASEGGGDLVLWDFHDLLFHARSSEGRHANPLGGLYTYATVMPALPAVRPRWPGKTIDLHKLSPAQSQPILPAAKLLRERASTAGHRSPSASLRAFSMAPRGSSPVSRAAPISAKTVRWSTR